MCPKIPLRPPRLLAGRREARREQEVRPVVRGESVAQQRRNLGLMLLNRQLPRQPYGEHEWRTEKREIARFHRAR